MALVIPIIPSKSPFWAAAMKALAVAAELDAYATSRKSTREAFRKSLIAAPISESAACPTRSPTTCVQDICNEAANASAHPLMKPFFIERGNQ